MALTSAIRRAWIALNGQVGHIDPSAVPRTTLETLAKQCEVVEFHAAAAAASAETLSVLSPSSTAQSFRPKHTVFAPHDDAFVGVPLTVQPALRY